MSWMTFLFVIFLILPTLIFGDTDIKLPPIVKTGTPGEILLDDPIRDPLVGETFLNAGSGSIQNSIQNQIALPLADYGRPGNAAQVRGLGPSAEDVDVQSFGISLNPPQGGGFDLSVFPQYLWSSFQYQSGPSLNALNPSAASGTLTLVPWSVASLRAGDEKRRATEFYSTAGVNQVSAAGTDGKNVSAVAGYSSLKVRGPSSGFSSVWGRQDGSLVGYQGEFHFLASDLDSDSLGSVSYSTSQAHIRNTRLIPVLQNNFKLGPSNSLKTSLFYDWGYLGYEDPDLVTGSFSRSYIQQWGSENVYLNGPWKLGLSARQVRYRTTSSFSSFEIPIQTLGHIQVSRAMGNDVWLFEPTVQGVWVTGYGLLPQGSLGLRRDWDHARRGLFSRFSISHRLPTLLDRYSDSINGMTPFKGNPDLKTETDWTGLVGADWKGNRFHSNLQVQVQRRKDARVSVQSTVTNLGDASLVALSAGGSYTGLDFAEISDSITSSYSLIDLTGTPFPYVPSLLNVLSWSVFSPQKASRWTWTSSLRFSTLRWVDVSTGSQLSGYVVMDSQLKFQVGENISLVGRAENVFDRTLEYIKDYPVGRVLSVMVSGEF